MSNVSFFSRMFKLCCSQSNVHPSPPITQQLLATKYKDFFICQSFQSKAMLSGCTAVTEDGLGPWLHDGVSQLFFFLRTRFHLFTQWRGDRLHALPRSPAIRKSGGMTQIAMGTMPEKGTKYVTKPVKKVSSLPRTTITKWTSWTQMLQCNNCGSQPHAQPPLSGSRHFSSKCLDRCLRFSLILHFLLIIPSSAVKDAWDSSAVN